MINVTRSINIEISKADKIKESYYKIMKMTYNPIGCLIILTFFDMYDIIAFSSL